MMGPTTMGKEVSGRVLLSMLGAVRARGHDPAQVIEGLPFRVEDLRRNSFRVDWRDFETFWARVDALLGGDAGMEQMAVDLVHTSFVLRVLGRVFLTPRQFYLGFVPKMGRAVYSNVKSTMVPLDDDRVVWESRTLPGYTFPLSFGAATRGLLRAYPHLLDLPDARVEGTSSETFMRYVITLPAPRTIAAAWSRLAGRQPETQVDPDNSFDVASPEELAQFLDTRAAPPDQVHDFGASLPASQTVDALAGSLTAFLEAHFLIHTFALWTSTPEGGLSLAAVSRDGRSSAVHSRDLVVGGRHVGRIDVDGAALHPGAAAYDEFEALLPWVAMALARLIRPEHGAEASLADAVRDSGLTGREAEVLRWIREGKTDREVAEILGISHRTVQKHVERLLVKMGVESRLAAARRTFEEA